MDLFKSRGRKLISLSRQVYKKTKLKRDKYAIFCDVIIKLTPQQGIFEPINPLTLLSAMFLCKFCCIFFTGHNKGRRMIYLNSIYHRLISFQMRNKQNENKKNQNVTFSQFSHNAQINVRNEM
jgi:hypothetical protein